MRLRCMLPPEPFVKLAFLLIPVFWKAIAIMKYESTLNAANKSPDSQLSNAPNILRAIDDSYSIATQRITQIIAKHRVERLGRVAFCWFRVGGQWGQSEQWGQEVSAILVARRSNAPGWWSCYSNMGLNLRGGSFFRSAMARCDGVFCRFKIGGRMWRQPPIWQSIFNLAKRPLQPRNIIYACLCSVALI